jgi:aminoglycoside 6'-N-acetyltransferase
MLLDGRITLRPMSLADVPLLDLWDRQPHVMAATSDDPDQPKAFGDTYWPDELALVGPDCQYLVAELDGRPIGAMQIIDPHTEETHYWGQIEPNLIWIGVAEGLGKGYGESDALTNPLVYTFWGNQGPSIMTMSSALADA